MTTRAAKSNSRARMYLVQHWNAWPSWMSAEGILYLATNRHNVVLFRSRSEALAAIRRSLRYSLEKGRGWKYDDYSIKTVEVPLGRGTKGTQ